MGQGLSFSARSNDVVMFFWPATFKRIWAAESTDLRFSFMVVTCSFHISFTKSKEGQDQPDYLTGVHYTKQQRKMPQEVTSMPFSR
jgi:hypothetical protein